VEHTVFIVEDHPVMREILIEFVDRDGFQVCGSAATGEDALKGLQQAGADVVLVDVSLPGMSGIELVRELRSIDPGRICLILSAHAGLRYIQGALEAGARGYIIKGNPHELLDALRIVLQGEIYFSEAVRQTLAEAGQLR
jgi:DNA-binding NarL/FixJ family response regulator